MRSEGTLHGVRVIGGGLQGSGVVKFELPWKTVVQKACKRPAVYVHQSLSLHTMMSPSRTHSPTHFLHMRATAPLPTYHPLRPHSPPTLSPLHTHRPVAADRRPLWLRQVQPVACPVGPLESGLRGCDAARCWGLLLPTSEALHAPGITATAAVLPIRCGVVWTG